MAYHDENYDMIKCDVLEVRPKAVLLEYQPGNVSDFTPPDTMEAWIPRSLIHAADDLNLEREVMLKRIRVIAWKARDLGWTA